MLVSVGNGELPVEAVPDMLRAGDRKLAPLAAPSHGLCLAQVRYPEPEAAAKKTYAFGEQLANWHTYSQTTETILDASVDSVEMK